MGIEIGRVVQEWTGDDVERHDLMAYIHVTATLDGTVITLATMVGVPPHQHGSCRAAGAGVRPYLTTWWSDVSDWQNVSPGRREEAELALLEAAPRLWRQVQSLREGA